jgi:hypothetical protein
VEDYRRSSKNMKSAEDQKPPAENEIRISHNKIPVYFKAGIKLLQVSPTSHNITLYRLTYIIG